LRGALLRRAAVLATLQPAYQQTQDVMNLIVVNESKLRRDSVMPKLPLIEVEVRWVRWTALGGAGWGW